MNIPRMDSLEKALIALVATTGAAHVYAGLQFSFPKLTLAGAGFFGGAALFLKFSDYRELLAGLVLPYTGYQIVAYYQLYGLEASGVALVDKVVQVGLLFAAGFYLYRERVADRGV